MNTPPPTYSRLIDAAHYLLSKRTHDRALVAITTDSTQTFTYGEYFARAAGYADTFRELGLKPGELVVLIQQPSADVMFAFWGALLMGAVPAIFPFLTEKLDLEYYARMVQKLVNISRPRLITTYPDLEPTLKGAFVDLPEPPMVTVTQPGRVGDADAWIAAYPDHITPDQVAFLQHSSGTTGLQKGITFSHQATLRYVESASSALGLSEADTYITWLPLYHDMGLIGTFMMPFLAGVGIVTMSPFQWVRDPKVMLRAFHSYGGTVTWMPNFALNFMAQRINPDDLEGLDLSSWRLLVNASEPVRAESNHLFSTHFAPYGFKAESLGVAWGTAETIMAITYTPLGQPPTIDWVDRKRISEERIALPVPENAPESMAYASCGRLIRGMELKIVDEEGRELPERRVGNVLVRGEYMFSGYYHRPDLTENAFQEGWFKTGDLGYVAEGELYICGRKKDLIIVGGKNVYPQDLEDVLNTVSGVKAGRAVAFGMLNEALGTEDIYVICEVTTPDPDERRKIEREIRQRLTRQADVTAHRVILKDLGWLVKSTSGKMARSANRDKYIQELQAQTAKA